MEAYFAGGCFWCITPLLKKDAVTDIIAGYSGGDEENPAYEQVKHQETGHREAIKVIFNEEIMSYRTLVKLFLNSVDPFDGGGQFIDRGFSYTLAIYYADEAQKAVVDQEIHLLEEKAGKPCQIAVEPFKAFWEAEDYHQDYHEKNPEAFEEEWEKSGREAVFGSLKKL